MSPSWRGIPEVLGRLFGPIPLLLLPPSLLLLLLLCPHASRGDCKLPPQLPNSQADLKGLTSFRKGDMVTYICDKGFFKIPGKTDTVFCLENNEWSQITAFCNRSCNVPTRLSFASLKTPYKTINYFPLGIVVEYECRKGFIRNHSLSGNITCLQNYTWSEADEFCKKKSCPNPGEIINGHITIKTSILFGGLITFSCNTGYELVGVTFTYCLLKGDDVDWGDPFPECKESPQISKVTPAPQMPTTTDVPGTKAPSTAQRHTTVIVPATEVTSTPQELITVNFSATEAPLTPQKSTTLNIPAIEFPSSLQKPVTANVPAAEATSTPQKPTKINSSATKTLLTAQKSTLHVPTNPQKPTSNISVMETPSTPQKPTKINSSATKTLLTAQKSTLHVPTNPQKPTSSISVMETPSTPQKPTKINSSATKTLLIAQKSTLHVPTNPQKPTSNISVMETPSTPQKPITANDSFTIAKITPVSNALSTETPSAAQTPIMANSSVTQTIPKTQRLTTAKASFTQSLPGTQKFTAIHAPVTKSLHTTQRRPSAPISATRSKAVPRTSTPIHARSTPIHATTPIHARRTPTGKGTPSAGVSNIILGIVAVTSITGIIILGKIFWDRGKSGSYYPQENNKTQNVTFHNLNETGNASEV
ncbi:complement decay-accelerating factor isoform X2 [Artibeus jamaicensis]|uniref:complement decay-accelerating factor isoform X2 n=1 Tax=Artibeus jamaicensis TaxID=9417 RepID=UPI00235B1511|nr:complement decay-accelerating factor isoform X2 [Artibeus jamaicensis]